MSFSVVWILLFVFIKNNICILSSYRVFVISEKTLRVTELLDATVPSLFGLTLAMSTVYTIVYKMVTTLVNVAKAEISMEADWAVRERVYTGDNPLATQ